MTTLLAALNLVLFVLAGLVAVNGTGRMALHAIVAIRRRTGASDLRLKTVKRRLGPQYHTVAAVIGTGLLALALGLASLAVPAGSACNLIVRIAAIASLLYFVLRD